MSEAVKVFVRTRPFNGLERREKATRVVFVNKDVNQISIKKNDSTSSKKTFTFDGVYDPGTQVDVYEETAHDLVLNVMDGFNGTIFAYGQTGCGKTFTMMGEPSPAEVRGIIPRSFEHIFETIETNSSENMSFLVSGAFIEIYNEEIRDLLAKDHKAKLQLKEHPEKGVFVQGLTHTVVKTKVELATIMERGNKKRTVGETRMNKGSSRSHSIFIINVETVVHDEAMGDRFTAGKLNLVDLAGSERQSKTGAEGVRLKEATKINLSLSALGNVISALVAGKSKHIPYRDSKLTRLLQDSLGGNTKTVMIAALSPASYNYDETLSTLRYANRAKNIKNKPVKNEDPKDALLREYQEEIERLKAMLEAQAKGLPLDTIGSQPKSPQKKLQVDDGKVTVLETQEDVDELKETLKRTQDESRRKQKELQERLREERENIEQLIKDREMILKEKDELHRCIQQQRETLEKSATGPTLPGTSIEPGVASLDESVGERSQEILKQQEVMERVREREQRIEKKLAEKQYIKERMEQQFKKDSEKLQTREEELRQRIRKEERAALEASRANPIQQLRMLQEKLLRGGAMIQSRENAKQKAELEKMKKRAKQERKEKIRLAKQQAKLEEEKVLIEEKFADIREEVKSKTRKLKKLKGMYKKLKEELKSSKVEISDLQDEFESEREGYLNNIRDIYREMTLQKEILRLVLPLDSIRKIEGNATWDDENDCWKLPEVSLPTQFPKVHVRRNSRPPRHKGRGRSSSRARSGEYRSHSGKRGGSAGHVGLEEYGGGALGGRLGSEGRSRSGSANRSRSRRSRRPASREASYFPDEPTASPAPKAPARLRHMEGPAGVDNGFRLRTSVASPGIGSGAAAQHVGRSKHRSNLSRKSRGSRTPSPFSGMSAGASDPFGMLSAVEKPPERAGVRLGSESMARLTETVQPRPRFEPARIGSAAVGSDGLGADDEGGMNMSSILSTTAPSRPKFEPAVHMLAGRRDLGGGSRSSAGEGGSAGASILSTMDSVPIMNRPKFRPAKPVAAPQDDVNMRSAIGGGGSSMNAMFRDIPLGRPKFKPAGTFEPTEGKDKQSRPDDPMLLEIDRPAFKPAFAVR